MAPILSKRNREKFNHEGHLFCFHKSSSDGETHFWQCDKRDSDECKVRLHTSAETNVVLRLINIHTHRSDVAEVVASEIRTGIKRHAEETAEIPSIILNNAYEGVSISVRGKLGTKDTMRKVIQRKRNKIQAAPSTPADLASIVIPDIYQIYKFSEKQQEQFLLYDLGEGDDKRILIFGRQSHITWTHQMKKLYVDGTFSLAPLLFSQVYVIMAEKGGFVFPVLYVLLPDKREETYKRMFNAIKQMVPSLNPTSISTDFELAALNAMRFSFPDAELFGCLFHLTKNMRKKLAQEGLLQRYNADPDFSLIARMIVALAFVPLDHLENAFEELSNETSEDLQPILNWFEDSYLGCLDRRGNRRVATFPSVIWSVYERTINGDDRTNNFAEAAHRRLQAEFGVDHPTLWKFIEGIRKVQAGRDQHYEGFVRGDAPAVKQIKYRQADEKILKIVQNFDQRTIMEYLRGISHNFLMN